jgi:hypothetical protein
VKNPSFPVVISSEHQDFRWCDISAVMEVTEQENMQNAFRACEEFLNNKLFPSK